MKPLPFTRSMVYGIALAVVFFSAALLIGLAEGKVWLTFSLIGTSLLLEAQPSAVASIPLGFHPLSGAVISILANLIPVPLIILTLDQIVHRWKWVNRKLNRAEKWSAKYGRYGVWSLIFLSPFLGAYVSIALGVAMRWRVLAVFVSVMIGMCVSVFVITFGGHWIVTLFRRF